MRIQLEKKYAKSYKTLQSSDLCNSFSFITVVDTTVRTELHASGVLWYYKEIQLGDNMPKGYGYGMKKKKKPSKKKRK